MIYIVDQHIAEYQLSISNSLLLPQHTVEEVFDQVCSNSISFFFFIFLKKNLHVQLFQFNRYFGEGNSERDTVEDIDHPEASENGREDGDEASDCENYEEIVTEFVVPSEELENLEAVEGDHEVTEGDREPVEKGPQHGERGNEAFEERIDTVGSAVGAEGSTRKRCHPCVHCTEVFMHRFTKKV